MCLHSCCSSAISHASTDWFQFKSDLRRGKQGHSSTSQTLAFLLEAWMFICSNQSLKEQKKSETNTNEKRMADLAATKRQWIGLSGCQTLASLPSTTKRSAPSNLFLLQFWLSFFPSFSPLAAAARYQRRNIKGCLQSAPTAANYWKWNRNGVSSHVLSSHLIIALQKWPKNDKTLQVQVDTASQAPNAPRTTTPFIGLVRLQI